MVKTFWVYPVFPTKFSRFLGCRTITSEEAKCFEQTPAPCHYTELMKASSTAVCMVLDSWQIGKKPHLMRRLIRRWSESELHQAAQQLSQGLFPAYGPENGPLTPTLGVFGMPLGVRLLGGLYNRAGEAVRRSLSRMTHSAGITGRKAFLAAQVPGRVWVYGASNQDS